MHSFLPKSAGAHERVDLTDDKALRGWADRLGVTEERLSAAVLAVGSDIQTVEAYFAEGDDLSSWEEAWDAVTPLETRGKWDIFIR